ncbi:NlpC/P60 family protein [Paenibacillus motobuensis]|uniref:NlpC/P60 family protein n=1 Tax=Paenibacillus TaxID=44249 RepID=UPI00203C533C|nr:MULTISPECIES: NlpC/P60 family protein [Paenibacillus]MCM3042830.1 NlpC/P60 family protein [Paenibacillus lutimineralis]MCM3649934.1 NlpC/P60 family protein [Paenibacillus motobuensis]
MSSIKVDSTKLEELSASLKRLGGTVEDREKYINSIITELIRDVRRQYSEQRDVQLALNQVEEDLREVRLLADKVTQGLAKKSTALLQASGQYQAEEKATQRMIGQTQPPSTYYSSGGDLVGDGLNNYLMDKLFEDPVVQELHLKAMNGTEEERQEAKGILDAIFKARDTIARAQVAYATYKLFGNSYLMEMAHKEAMRQRNILKGYGINEELWKEGVNLSHLYTGTALQACSYDPTIQLTKDGKPVSVLMPKDNQYTYLLGLVLKGGSEGAWAKKQLDEIHKWLSEIGRAQVAWQEYKANNMKKEMEGAHKYAEKLRTELKNKYSLSSEMVEDVDFKYMWTGMGTAGKYLNVVEIETKTKTKTTQEIQFYLKEKNKEIKDIKGIKNKILALYNRNSEILPYISIDTLNKETMNSLRLFQAHYSKYKEKYETVSKKTGVPPELIAAIHWREGSGDFTTYLHNGDPLGKKTVHVPKDVLFYSWEEAAVDAINMKKVLRDYLNLSSSSQDIPKMMAFAESYNGLGYVNHNVNSVYIFSGSNIPLEGKYYSDGKFTYGPVRDSNPGIAIMLLSIMNLKEITLENPKTELPVPSNNSKPTKNSEVVRDKVVELARKFEGKVPYYMDERRPIYLDPDSPPEVMDCSDFTSAVYRTILRDLGVGESIDIGSNTRAQKDSGLEVWSQNKGEFNTSQLKKGDLILFSAPDSSQVGHVGIYIGDGKFIHESGSNKKGGNIKISELKGYWLSTQRPMTVRRIIGDDGNVYSQNGKKKGEIL